MKKIHLLCLLFLYAQAVCMELDEVTIDLTTLTQDEKSCIALLQGLQESIDDTGASQITIDCDQDTWDKTMHVLKWWFTLRGHLLNERNSVCDKSAVCGCLKVAMRPPKKEVLRVLHKYNSPYLVQIAYAQEFADKDPELKRRISNEQDSWEYDCFANLVYESKNEEPEMHLKFNIGYFNQALFKGKISKFQLDGHDTFNFSGKDIPDIQGIHNISDFHAMKILDVSHCVLKDIPEELFTCQGLEELQLSCNSLDHISPLIGKLTKLKRIKIFSNVLKILPDEIGECQELEEIDGSYNYLTGIPKSVGKLTNLQRLYLHANKLTELPNELSNCYTLESLSTHDNLLKALPLALENIPTLKFLTFDTEKLDQESRLMDERINKRAPQKKDDDSMHRD